MFSEPIPQSDNSRLSPYLLVFLSPCLLVLVIGLTAGCAKKWKATAAAPLLPWIECLAFSPDDKTLATVADQGVTLWDVQTGKEKLSFAGHTIAITAVAFTQGGKKLVTGGHDHALIL